MAYLYRAHGLLLSSEAELPLSPASSASGEPDLTLRLGPALPVPDEPAPGEPLAELHRNGSRVYSFGRDADRVVLRYPGLCELVGNRELGEVTAYPHPGTDRGLLGVLAGGNLLAVHLILRRCLVLHASAVNLAGRTVAFVGASGMGKSTLAAAYCAAGAALVTDDVLRVDRDADGQVLVHAGATENRLRAGADRLADASGPEVRRTADGRLAVRSRRRVDGALPLAACVVPLTCREADHVTVRRLRPAAAMQWLLRFPKVLGWSEPESARHTFQALGDLAEQVPVFEATVPWGLPFRPDTLTGLWDATG